jgi:hypothetical protein
MARKTFTIPSAFYTDPCVLAECSGGMVRKTGTASIIQRVFVSVEELEQAIKKYVNVNNQKNKPFRWTKTAESILKTHHQITERTNQMIH